VVEKGKTEKGAVGKFEYSWAFGVAEKVD